MTNGSPFAFGYAAAHGSLHDLGFGQRGFVAPDLLGRPMNELVDFTVGRAFSNLFIVMSNLAPIVLPAFLFIPILVIGRQHGFAVRWATVCAFLVLPAVHFFYFYFHTRFYLELFPFLFVGLAGILAHVRRRIPRWLAPSSRWCWGPSCSRRASTCVAERPRWKTAPGMP